MDQSSSDARNEKIVADLKLDSMIYPLALCLKHVVELLCLDDCAWESVEDESIVCDDDRPSRARE